MRKSNQLRAKESRHVLGIDVSKKTLDAALLDSSESTHKARHKVFADTPTGHQQMLDWMAQNEVAQIHACLEATGTYGEGIARALYEAGHKVSLVNPMLTSHENRQGGCITHRSLLCNAPTGGLDASHC